MQNEKPIPSPYMDHMRSREIRDEELNTFEQELKDLCKKHNVCSVFTAYTFHQEDEDHVWRAFSTNRDEDLLNYLRIIIEDIKGHLN